MQFQLPVKGIYFGVAIDKSPSLTSGYMNNTRGVCVLEGLIRVCQRPGQDKVYTQQISGASAPIAAICSVTVAS